uniref:Voltage-dependent calcium channel type A subunit alpha-1-like n=1 Tax=Crassostrea virginica TaxID=6565 RepID=A0A8B8D5D1_CRAVI|nr:voltage-dependent calcium channel type A subunit alpha-1-like [Crassostrea virginica]
MILTISANCIVLALEEYLPNKDRTERTQKLEKSEIYFLTIYIIEAVLKIISKGFVIGKTTYLRDNWNKLDFVVVVFGLVEYFVTIQNSQFDFSLLRMARVLRAFKLISGSPKMKVVATTILRSVRPLLPVFFLVVLTVLIFAILGMDYYKGAFNTACFETEHMYCNQERLCHYEMIDSRPCQKDPRGSGYHCPGNTTCRRTGKAQTRELQALTTLVWHYSDFSKQIEMIRVLYVRRLVESSAFFWGTMACVAVNTIIAATEHYNQPQELGKAQYLLEIIFVVLFGIEIILRICAHGYGQYFFSKFNIFDLLVLVASIAELIIRYWFGNNGLKCSVFRAIRLLRVFDKTRYKSDIDNLVKVMIGSISSVLSLLFLLFLFLFVASVLGMQLFGGRFNFDEGRPEGHFDSFPRAILTVFQVVTGEDWNAVMYNGVRSYGGIEGTGAAVVIFFIIVVLFGNYTLLNVFFAIAVDSLAEAKELSSADDQKAKQKNRQRHSKNANQLENTASPVPNRICLDPERSLFVFKRDNGFRKFVHSLINRKEFEGTVIACIVLSSITLAAEDPTTDHNSIRNQVLFWVDAFFATIFTVEMIMKVIDMGFLLHRGSYLRELSNCFDAIIVVASLVSLFIGSSSVKSLKIFRILRVFRIFRTISKFAGLKSACVMFMKSIKSVGPLLLIYVLMHVTFSIMAVQLLQGRLFYCNDSTKLTRDQCRGRFIHYTEKNGKLEVLDREWRRRDFHFDNVFSAMSTLFVITTGEGWPNILDSAVSSVGVDQGPRKNSSPGISIFFIVYIAIAPFFFLNVFIAMITVAFQSEDVNKKKSSGLTNNQENCILYVVKAKPDQTRFIPKDASKLRRNLWKIILSDHFENVVLFIVILNTVCLGMEYQDQPVLYTEVLRYLNFAFVAAFVLEAALKFYVLRKNYLSDNWNRIDIVLVVGSVIDAVLDLLKIPGINIRVFRAARILKVLKKLSSLRFLLWSFYLSMKSLPYVFFLNFLSFYVFAVLGMQIFGNIQIEEDSDINKYNNFRNIFTSFLVLFRCVTGENWQNVMLACMGGRACAGENSDDSCGSDFAYVYFIGFICLSAFLMMNLFEAVIVNNFDYLHTDPANLGPQHLYTFTDQWLKYANFYDPLTMEVEKLEDFVKSMNPPLGFGNNCPRRQMRINFLKMDLPLTKREACGRETLCVHFNSVMFGLVRLTLNLHRDEWTDGHTLRR